ncbi:hypothetical protein [Enterococcus faecalis]|uniref:hypothetical protein n=1 Tax=Enterococcus faecalis TaxID=1351 RepID=UPI000CF14D86|nr:hypothetical protein [Enterococcus faecalis]EGO6585885.1 hypothetical protein [Enterococcus faecalis]EGO7983695.1 hypothetical protein [Enterococcus faecalis]EGO8255006.1 hypothetical protein [Enterococcus faecalis]EGS1176555.1 hypothetical protein [Enterococcus faecalis]EHV0174812.1 hypothetical protein [Enterococcus faecalis]
MNKPEIKVDVSIEGIDEATKKAERYVEVLKEAKTLAGELASMHFEISVNEKDHTQRKELMTNEELYIKTMQKINYSNWNWIRDNVLIFTLGIVVGCMLFQLFADLWKW